MLSGLLPHLLPHQSCSYSRLLFARRVPSLRPDAPRTALHSRAEALTRRRLPTHCHNQYRGVKGRNRKFQEQQEDWKSRNNTLLTYIAAAGVGMIGLSYAAVPLYRLYCQVRQTECVYYVATCASLRPVRSTRPCLMLAYRPGEVTF